MTSKPHSDKGPRGTAPLTWCKACGKPGTERGHYGDATHERATMCHGCGECDVDYHAHFDLNGWCLKQPVPQS